MTDTRASEEETIVIERGDGNFIYDDTGRKLLMVLVDYGV